MRTVLVDVIVLSSASRQPPNFQPQASSPRPRVPSPQPPAPDLQLPTPSSPASSGVVKNVPVHVGLERVRDGVSDARACSRDVMLEPTPADDLQERLESRDLHDAVPTKRLE